MREFEKTLNCGARLHVWSDSNSDSTVLVTGRGGEVGASVHVNPETKQVELRMFITNKSLAELRDIINEILAPPPAKSNVVQFPSVSEQSEAELEPRPWDGKTIGPVLTYGRE